jgi:hypothetical protein
MALTPLPQQPIVQSTRTVGGAVLATASDPITVTGETAAVTNQAEAGASASLGTGVVVVGATAQITMSAVVATAFTEDDSGSDLIAEGETAVVVSVVAPAGSAYVGTPAAGDPWQSPTLQSSQSGTTVWSTASYTVQAEEPTSSGTFYRSRWFKFTAAAGELSFTATAGTDVILDVFDVGGNFSDPSEWSTIGYASGTSATVSAVFPDAVNGIYVRVSATTDTTYDITLTHTTTVFPPPDSPTGNGSTLQVYDPVIEIAPWSVTFAIFNLEGDETVTVSLSPNPLGFPSITVDSDESGVILGETFELDGDLPAGTYSLVADTSTGPASDTFIIEQEPILHPGDLDSDDDELPDDAPPAGPFTKWTFVDPAGLMADFEFTYNPETMTSPYVPRTYITDSTTSPVGQPQVWEALSPGTNWEFAGYVDNETELDLLLSWLNVKRRIWVIDHRQRKWVVALTSIDPQPKRVFAKPYATRYKVTALLFKEAT